MNSQNEDAFSVAVEEGGTQELSSLQIEWPANLFANACDNFLVGAKTFASQNFDAPKIQWSGGKDILNRLSVRDAKARAQRRVAEEHCFEGTLHGRRVDGMRKRKDGRQIVSRITRLPLIKKPETLLTGGERHTFGLI